MPRVATPDDLNQRLQSLLDEAGTAKPSRTRLASGLAQLSRDLCAGLYLGFNSPGQWYKQEFRTGDEVLYWQASGQSLKNGNADGVMVTVQLDRPRAKPRAKRVSIPTAFQRQWTHIEVHDVPPNVVQAAAAFSSR